MFTLAEKPQTISQNIRSSIQLWLHSYYELMIVTFIAVLIGTAPHFFLPELNSYNLHVFLSYIAKNWLFFFLYYILAAFFFSIIIFRLYLIMIVAKQSYSGTITYVLSRFPSIIIGAILAMILISFGMLFLFIPGFYLIISLSFLIPLILIDELNVIEAFKSCFDLINNNWWRTFAVIFIMMLIFHLIIILIEQLALDLIVIHHPRGPIWLSYHLFRLIINAIYYPLVSSTLLVLLHDLKLRKEARAIVVPAVVPNSTV